MCVCVCGSGKIIMYGSCTGPTGGMDNRTIVKSSLIHIRFASEHKLSANMSGQRLPHPPTLISSNFNVMHEASMPPHIYRH